VVITSDEGNWGGKSIATKDIVDAALNESLVEHVLVLKTQGTKPLDARGTSGRAESTQLLSS
jgi:acyl-coenzyme A synthetase/AMP-(fatty) acid ligase